MLHETMHRMVHFSFLARGRFDGRFVQPGGESTTALPPAAAETSSSIPPEVYDAFFYGLLSAISFPLGSILGIWCSPVSPFVVSMIIAFGAGSLLFAVTVELYGEQLKHLEEHNHHQEGVIEVGVCLGMAMIGALIYIMLNRYVESLSEGGEHESAEGGAPALQNAEHGASEDGASISSPEATPRKEGREEPAAHQKGSKWKKTKSKVLMTARINKSLLETRRSKFNMEKTLEAAKEGSSDAKTLAFGMFVGVLADGLPESILIGFLASSGKLSLMFVLSLFIANFPESFSASSLMHEHKAFSPMVIVGLWTVPCLLPAILAALACYLVPEDVQGLRSVEMIAASIEGIAGGMMLAMIGSVMLPEAFNMAKKAENPFNRIVAEEHHHHGADVPGVLCVAGFLVAVGMKVTGGVVTARSAQEVAQEVAHHFFF